MSIEELIDEVLNKVTNEKEKYAIVSAIRTNPDSYNKYLNMRHPLAELLADWA